MKNILFITGTRADFGKLKSLMQSIEISKEFRCQIFITGMHTLERYGYTAREILKHRFKNTYIYHNQLQNESMDQILANTIYGISHFVSQNRPDFLIVHGDRVEALAGAIVGSINNILVGHIEGGDVSGTIDESIRHAISKLAHTHFVSHKKAHQRLIQLGEKSKNIYIIGSPNMDIMFSKSLPSIDLVKKRYNIPFKHYHIVLFHPVTSELNHFGKYTKNFVDALIKSEEHFVIIYPNNDSGTDLIFKEYERLKQNLKFCLLPSMRFEYFISLLKATKSVIGNSSAGVIEAPVFSKPTINIGTRQNNRFSAETITNVSYSPIEILAAIKNVSSPILKSRIKYFGTGNSASKFIKILQNRTFWSTPTQKKFTDLIVQ